MEEIIKTLLLEGIDEDTIHRVLDVIEEEYEVVCERNDRELLNRQTARKRALELAEIEPPEDSDKTSRIGISANDAINKVTQRMARREQLAGRKANVSSLNFSDGETAVKNKTNKLNKEASSNPEIIVKAVRQATTSSNPKLTKIVNGKQALRAPEGSSFKKTEKNGGVYDTLNNDGTMANGTIAYTTPTRGYEKNVHKATPKSQKSPKFQ